MYIKAKKSLGQNFLINPHILDKIISAAEVSKNDTIIEVGPGTGNLTKKLADKAGKIIAIEKDHRLIESLREDVKKYPNIEIIEGDILKINLSEILINDYKIVANIPYYITSHFLRMIFESAHPPASGDRWPQPKLIVLTIQKEVAQRIIAKPPHMNLLALSVQYYSEPKIIGYISKNNFRPVPKIDSAIICFKPKALSLKLEETTRLFQLIKIGFSEKRKQLSSLLSKRLKIDKELIVKILEQSGLAGTIRSENLSLEQWESLNKLLLR